MTSLLLALIYLAFISLGLPDGLLGAAWPVMHPELGVPMDRSGVIFGVIALGTVVSSLLSDRLTRRLGPGRVTAISVATTAAALLGFSFSRSYWALVLWAIPYGLGAGGVDAALNNYVALHYASRHMSWLHCMWGIGAAAGPYVMSAALTGGFGWHAGYRWIGFLQVGLTAVLLLSLPLWKNREAAEPGGEAEKALSLPVLLRVPGVRAVMLCFFCYCAIEQTVGLWAATWLVNARGIGEVTAAGYAGLFYLGVTLGRGAAGFLTLRLSDTRMVRLGHGLIALGLMALLLPLGNTAALIGLVVVGLGCAPVYPSLIHATPAHFGADRSQAVIGVQMASAYTGTFLMPPLFGFLANALTVELFPWYLLLLLIAMFLAHRVLCAKTEA